MTADTFALVLLGLLAAMLVWAAVVDIRTRTIPDGLNIAIALLAPVFWWAAGVELWPDAAERVGVALAVFALFAGFFYLGGMGGGDVKMAGALSLWFGPMATLYFLVITSLAGGIVSLATAWWHKRSANPGKAEVPYGVAIAVGGLWLLAQRFLNHFA